ncbi:UNVERIFIED_CONTAM: hypothetical protein Slati_2769400 [Sesamum latifolium]|uniref:Uncharacterized protein n=1 Tax=Sesamum latifolium TaxID=2727402 RepID=A0AAW2W2F2_9LAMI
MQIGRQNAVAAGDCQGEPVKSTAQLIDLMLVDKGLVPVPVVFLAKGRRGVGYHRRAMSGAERRGAVAQKQGPLIGFLEFGEEEVHKTKRGHLMDDDSDIVSAKAATRPCRSP